MRITRVCLADVRDDLTELVNRVRYSDERIIITRYGKDVIELTALWPGQMQPTLNASAASEGDASPARVPSPRTR